MWEAFKELCGCNKENTDPKKGKKIDAKNSNMQDGDDAGQGEEAASDLPKSKNGVNGANEPRIRQIQEQF